VGLGSQHPYLQDPADASSVHSGAGWGRHRTFAPSHDVGENNSHRSTNIVSSLPFRKINDPESELPQEKRRCIICLEKYEVGDEITTLPCIHVFHRVCVNRWLKSNRSCPECRTSVGKEDGNDTSE
jgi:Ring finger domain